MQMFTGKGREALQTLVNNGTITSQIHEAAKLTLNAIWTTKSRQMNISCLTTMSYSQISGRSQMNTYTH